MNRKKAIVTGGAGLASAQRLRADDVGVITVDISPC
jgi:hypothetical protein